MSNNKNSQLARMEIPERNLRVTCTNSNIMTWLSMGLMDPSFDEPVARGEVRVEPLEGAGNTVVYPHASDALKALRIQHNYPTIAVFWHDERKNRFIMNFMGTSRFIPLGKPLGTLRFIVEFLKDIMRHEGIPEKKISRVFTAPPPAQDKAQETEPEKSEEEEQEPTGTPLSELDLDTSIAKKVSSQGYNTLEALQTYVASSNGDVMAALIALEGIGEKSAEQLFQLLEQQG